MSFFGFGQRDSSGAKGGSYQSEESYGQAGGEEYDDPQGQQSRGGYGSQRMMGRGGADEEEDSQGYGNMQRGQDDSQGASNQPDLRSWSTYAPMVNTALSSVASKYGVDISSIAPGLGGAGGNQAMGQGMQGGAGNPSAYGHGDEEEEEEGQHGFMGGAGRQSQSSSFGGGANTGVRGREDYY